MSLNQDILDYYTDRLSIIATRSGLPAGHGGKVVVKKMFGGAGFYLNGRIFAITDGYTIYLKADDENRARYESRKMEQFVPFDDKPEMRMHYYSLSSEDLEDDDALRELCKLAIEASSRAAAKKRSSPTKRANTKK